MDPTLHNDQHVGVHLAQARSRKLIALGIIGFVMAVVALGVWAYTRQTDTSLNNAPNSDEQLGSNSARVNEAQDTLLIELTITGNADKLFGLAGITQYNGYSSDVEIKDAQYTLELVGGSEVIHTTSFNVPVVIAETLSADGTLARVATYPQKTIAVKTPFASEGTKFIVRDKAGKAVYEDSVRGIVKQESSADYETVPGDDIK